MSGNTLATIAARCNATVVPNAAGWTNSMAIKSGSSNKLYTVAQRTTDGSWGCSCLGWIMSAKRNNGKRGCKHLNAMMPVLQSAFKADSPKGVR